MLWFCGKSNDKWINLMNSVLTPNLFIIMIHYVTVSACLMLPHPLAIFSCMYSASIISTCMKNSVTLSKRIRYEKSIWRLRFLNLSDENNLGCLQRICDLDYADESWHYLTGTKKRLSELNLKITLPRSSLGVTNCWGTLMRYNVYMLNIG